MKIVAYTLCNKYTNDFSQCDGKWLITSEVPKNYLFEKRYIVAHTNKYQHAHTLVWLKTLVVVFVIGPVKWLNLE